jgi:hypothetical protein
MRPWEDLADSELFLVSVRDQDEAGHPQFGLNLGDGPWVEATKLEPMKEVTVGPADYILGKPHGDPQNPAHLILGRRAVPDLEVRLQLIDKQGKSWPAHDGFTQSSISDRRGGPQYFDGWGQYDSELKLQDVAEYVLQTRPTTWTTFSGFATEFVDLNQKPPQSMQVVRHKVPEDQFVTELCDKLDQHLRARAGTFLQHRERHAFVADFRQFITSQQPDKQPPERIRRIRETYDGALAELHTDYLVIFASYRSLKSRLWMALHQRELTADEVTKREAQREEFRQIIRKLPITEEHIPRTHGHAIALLERYFDNPWRPWFHEPLTDAEMQSWRDDLKNWDFSIMHVTGSCIDTMVARAKQSGDVPEVGSLPSSLAPDVVATYKSPLFALMQRCPDQTTFEGTNDLVFDDEKRRRVLEFGRQIVGVPNSVAAGAEAVQLWATETKQGVIGYDAKPHELYALRGTKLGVLTVDNWPDADRLTDDELRQVVRIQAKDSIPLEELYGPRPKETSYGMRPPGPLLVLQSPTGELGVLMVEAVSKQGITARLRARPGTKAK